MSEEMERTERIGAALRAAWWAESPRELVMVAAEAAERGLRVEHAEMLADEVDKLQRGGAGVREVAAHLEKRFSARV